MTDPVVRTFALGFPWATVDPFLFCVHHLDRYPAGNDVLGPAVALTGRDLGNDFSGRDGFSMYHGEGVPGFPRHPHRGFETVTYVRHGFIDHADSVGATARFGRGDTQWLTAGRGIEHCEMFPLLDPAAPNPTELFQIWLNLPAADKMVEPRFAMLWGDELPRKVTDTDGRAAEVTIIAGGFEGLVPPPPPPDSWAARPDTDVAVWHLVLDPSATLDLPPTASPGTVRTLYVFEGSVHIGEHRLEAPLGATLATAVPVTVAAGAAGAEALVLQGTPIGDPVVQYGPFVMNDRSGIERAFDDYRRTGFGRWPWPADAVVHPRLAGRFARYPDGRVEAPANSAAVPS